MTALLSFQEGTYKQFLQNFEHLEVDPSNGPQVLDVPKFQKKPLEIKIADLMGEPNRDDEDGEPIDLGPSTRSGDVLDSPRVLVGNFVEDDDDEPEESLYNPSSKAQDVQAMLAQCVPSPGLADIFSDSPLFSTPPAASSAEAEGHDADMEARPMAKEGLKEIVDTYDGECTTEENEATKSPELPGGIAGEDPVPVVQVPGLPALEDEEGTDLGSSFPGLGETGKEPDAMSTPIDDDDEDEAGGVDLCITCSEPSDMRCSRCKWAKYCSSSCQRKHWRAHKPVCVPASTPEQNAAAPTRAAPASAPAHEESAPIQASVEASVGPSGHGHKPAAKDPDSWEDEVTPFEIDPDFDYDHCPLTEKFGTRPDGTPAGLGVFLRDLAGPPRPPGPWAPAASEER